MEDKKFDLEKAMGRLEEITVALDNPEVSLKESLDIYSEGVKLVNACREELSGIEKEMIILNTNTGDVEDDLPFNQGK